MKAVITNVKKSSGYSDLNGHTFEVKEVLSNIVCLKIPSKLAIEKFDSVDFSFKEVFIVDFETEFTNVKNQYIDTYSVSNSIKLDNLEAYKIFKQMTSLKRQH